MAKNDAEKLLKLAKELIDYVCNTEFDDDVRGFVRAYPPAQMPRRFHDLDSLLKVYADGLMFAQYYPTLKAVDIYGARLEFDCNFYATTVGFTEFVVGYNFEVQDEKQTYHCYSEYDEKQHWQQNLEQFCDLVSTKFSITKSKKSRRQNASQDEAALRMWNEFRAESKSRVQRKMFPVWLTQLHDERKLSDEDAVLLIGVSAEDLNAAIQRQRQFIRDENERSAL